MSNETEQAAPRAWMHTRKGRIAGRVIHQVEEWTTIVCTEPNRQADVGDELTFRNSLAVEIEAGE